VPSDKRARQRAAREARLEAEAKHKKQRQRIRNVVIIMAAAAAIVGIAFAVSSGNKGSAKPSAQQQANQVAVRAGCPESPSTRVNTQTYAAAPPMTIDTSKTYTATVKTTLGTFVIDLDPKAAPKTVNNFVFLAKKGYYHCVIFHRVIPGFMNQTGDPTGTGRGTPGYTIPDENPPKAANASTQYPLGALAMANEGSPHTGGSQFFIVAGPEGEGLPNTYALFGQVSSGMSVVDAINKDGSTQGVPPKVTQRMLSVTINES
jgi:cyclophilin family peptidyl-prolyl cis-trans isomerase